MYSNLLSFTLCSSGSLTLTLTASFGQFYSNSTPISLSNRILVFTSYHSPPSPWVRDTSNPPHNSLSAAYAKWNWKLCGFNHFIYPLNWSQIHLSKIKIHPCLKFCNGSCRLTSGESRNSSWQTWRTRAFVMLPQTPFPASLLTTPPQPLLFLTSMIYLHFPQCTMISLPLLSPLSRMLLSGLFTKLILTQSLNILSENFASLLWAEFIISLLYVLQCFFTNLFITVIICF